MKLDYDNSDIAMAISECIHNERHRAILKRRLVDGLTYEEIAEEVDRTPRQIGYVMAKETPRIHAWMCSKIS